MTLNNCSLFKIDLFLGWLRRDDLVDMWFNLVLIKRSKEFLIGFSNLFVLSQFEGVTNNCFSLNFIWNWRSRFSPLSTLLTMLEILFSFLSWKIYFSWICWNSFLSSFFSCSWQFFWMFLNHSIDFFVVLSIQFKNFIFSLFVFIYHAL